MICPQCAREVAVGDWPWCPHPKGESAVIGDDIPGGLVMDHVEPGRKVYSKTELKAVLAKHGYQLANNCVENGGCKDKFISKWV